MADGTIPHPAIERAELRKQMVAAVNKMLEAVDLLIAELDGDATDPDLEPSLGAPEPSGGFSTTAFREALDQRQWARGGADDLEDAPDDHEPSLGSGGGTAASALSSQERWANGGSFEGEEEHDGREPDVDDELPLGWSEGAGWQHGDRNWDGSLGHASDDIEPSLGSLSGVDQRHWADDGDPAIVDGEDQCEDEGGACEDEGAITGDIEPEQTECCNWQDEGDQSTLRMLPFSPRRRPATARSRHSNVSGFIPVKVLE